MGNAMNWHKNNRCISTGIPPAWRTPHYMRDKAYLIAEILWLPEPVKISANGRDVWHPTTGGSIEEPLVDVSLPLCVIFIHDGKGPSYVYGKGVIGARGTLIRETGSGDIDLVSPLRADVDDAVLSKLSKDFRTTGRLNGVVCAHNSLRVYPSVCPAFGESEESLGAFASLEGKRIVPHEGKLLWCLPWGEEKGPAVVTADLLRQLYRAYKGSNFKAFFFRALADSLSVQSIKETGPAMVPVTLEGEGNNLVRKRNTLMTKVVRPYSAVSMDVFNFLEEQLKRSADYRLQQGEVVGDAPVFREEQVKQAMNMFIELSAGNPPEFRNYWKVLYIGYVTIP